MKKQFLDIPVSPPDQAFGLIAEFEADHHPNKVSLIAGAYRDENGDPWVLPCVKQVRRKDYLTFLKRKTNPAS
jgi:aspartate/tyrosine/aromatic aminotransferase